MRNQFLFLLILILSGCYTAKKAEQQVNKADSKYPEIVAKLARDKYPCTDILKPDTAVIWKDTTIYIDCPDTLTTTDFGIVRYDTINNIITRIVKVPVTLPVRIQTITKWYEDSAKLKLAAIEQTKLKNENTELATTVKNQTKKIANKNKELWIWRAIALAFIAWQIIRLWKSLTTIKIKS